MKDGGPAFPSEQSMNPDGRWNQTLDKGVSIRDWFAGKALPANIELVTSGQQLEGLPVFMSIEEWVARECYKYADAILAKREVMGMKENVRAVPQFDGAGYPTRETLQVIRDWEAKDFFGLAEYIVMAWRGREGFAHLDYKEAVLSLVTGGWPGNEDIVDAIADNALWSLLHWAKSERGGLHEYKRMPLGGSEAEWRSYPQTLEEWARLRREHPNALVLIPIEEEA